MGCFTIHGTTKETKIKRNIIINDCREGGLKMIDVDSFNRSLKAVWIKKYLDTEKPGKMEKLF